MDPLPQTLITEPVRFSGRKEFHITTPREAKLENSPSSSIWEAFPALHQLLPTMFLFLMMRFRCTYDVLDGLVGPLGEYYPRCKLPYPCDVPILGFAMPIMSLTSNRRQPGCAGVRGWKGVMQLDLGKNT